MVHVSYDAPIPSLLVSIGFLELAQGAVGIGSEGPGGVVK
jgi:hypothetical protein